MARPIKDNADYFTHDADMRDDPKIKALRRKFKIAGYGVWCMLLEAITDSDNFRLALDFEIMAGDFQVETEFLQEVVQYCIQLDLLQTDESCKTIRSKTLDNRFSALLSKRKRNRGELSTAKTPQDGVIDGESTQSRVKESRVKESMFSATEFFESNAKAFEEISSNHIDMDSARNTVRNNGWAAVGDSDVKALLFHFLESQADIQKQDKSDVRSHFRRWLNKQPSSELIKLSTSIHATKQRQSA